MSRRPEGSKRRRRLRWWALTFLAAAVAAGAVFALGTEDGERPSYRLSTVERGPLAKIVSASGTLRAVVTVDVGSQVSGQIEELRADYNTGVEKGQVIARLDPASFETLVRQAEAELAVATANLSMQRAGLGELDAMIDSARAALKEADRELARKRALHDRRVVPRSQAEKAEAARDRARAALKAAVAKLARQRAQVSHAEAQILQREAALRHRQLDLENTIIRSPVDGVVISRNVDIGQTVAASFQAPVLFTIARDLRHMQVEVSVDEADIGQIVRGQNVTFTVDTFPGRSFAGRVEQVRKAPREVSNVVTYTVVVTADNPDLGLLPGMTANVNVIVAKRENVLKVANAALRFRSAGDEGAGAGSEAPTPGGGTGRAAQAIARLTEELELSEEQRLRLRAIFRETGQKIRALRAGGASGSEIRDFAREARQRNRPRMEALLNEEQRAKFKAMRAPGRRSPARPGRVWLLGDDGAARPVPVVYGISDATMSEILRGEIGPGDRVIVGVALRASVRPPGRPRFGL